MFLKSAVKYSTKNMAKKCLHPGDNGDNEVLRKQTLTAFHLRFIHQPRLTREIP